jgi:hypothetical protein
MQCLLVYTFGATSHSQLLPYDTLAMYVLLAILSATTQLLTAALFTQTTIFHYPGL